MRIHYDHQVFSLQNTGGNTRYHFELMRHLAAQSGIEIDLFLGYYGGLTPIFENVGGNCGSLRVVGRPSFLSPGGKRYMVNEALNSAYALTRGRYDIYHPTHHRYLPLVRARRIAVTHHDCTQEKFPAEFRFNRQVLRWRKSLYARADAIICISEASRQDLFAFYDVDPAKTRVIHHGVTRLACPAADPRRFRRDFLLYVGSRALYKNFRALLRAFRDSGLYQDLDLLVLGGGPLSQEDSQLIAELGLGDSVLQESDVTDELLAQAYASACLFVYPSLSEGFGLPTLEAMALGCPVAASNLPVIQEVCRDAPIYFDPNDLASIAAALVKGVGESAARAQAVARGEAIGAEYTWEKCAGQTLALYREVAG